MHKPGADAEPACRFVDEHVADPGESGPVGDDTPVRELDSVAVHTHRQRTGDARLDDGTVPAGGPVRLFRQPAVDPIEIEPAGVGGELQPVRPAEGDQATVQVSFPRSRVDSSAALSAEL